MPNIIVTNELGVAMAVASRLSFKCGSILRQKEISRREEAQVILRKIWAIQQ